MHRVKDVELVEMVGHFRIKLLVVDVTFSRSQKFYDLLESL